MMRTNSPFVKAINIAYCSFPCIWITTYYIFGHLYFEAIHRYSREYIIVETKDPLVSTLIILNDMLWLSLCIFLIPLLIFSPIFFAIQYKLKLNPIKYYLYAFVIGY